MRLELPKWYDLHAHFRQGEIVPSLVADHLKMGCAGILAMPNTVPPVAKVLQDDPYEYDSIQSYLDVLRDAGGDQFDDIIVPLYLTAQTTPDMIADGAASGLLRACKYYPPHGTTGAAFGQPLDVFMENGVFAAMQEAGVVLCIHGEEHGLAGEQYFDRKGNAEEMFYKERMPALVAAYPDLKIVCEHVTTKVAVDFIQGTSERVVASVTPQHLLYTMGHLLQGLKYHLYCLPLVKFEEDRAALRSAVSAADNKKFFAGTDSAPHVKKMTECGCAAGCYTGGIAPQLYAQAFEAAGVGLGSEDGLSAFKAFLCENGARFYGLSLSEEVFVMEKVAQDVSVLDVGDQRIVPLPVGMHGNGVGPVAIPWRIV